MSAKKMNGFSLLELLVVIAILAVVSAIAVPAYQNTLFVQTEPMFNQR